MPTNEQITSSLVAGSVPPDRECVKSLSQVLAGVEDFMSIQNTGGETPSGPDNSIAEQALNTANTALAGVQALHAQQKEIRAQSPQAIPTGDSQTNFSWVPPMPDTNYDVYVTYYATAAGYASTFYGWRVVKSSVTVNGVSVLFDNTPANTEAAIRVIQR